MSIDHASVTVADTATSLLGDVEDSQGNHQRSILLSEPSATIYVGGPGVTDEDYGYKLESGGELPIDLFSGDVLYGVVASGTATVRVLHTGV
jgi:hypothetical protein